MTTLKPIAISFLLGALVFCPLVWASAMNHYYGEITRLTAALDAYHLDVQANYIRDICGGFPGSFSGEYGHRTIKCQGLGKR
jgi:hypothetical protein